MRTQGGQVKSKFVLIAMVCLLSVTQAQDLWGGESQRSRALVYTLEGIGALGGCAGCLCVPFGAAYACGYDVFTGLDDYEVPVFAFFLAVSALPAPAAVGLGTAGVGRLLHEDGSTGGAIGGAYGGAIVGAGLWFVTIAATSGQVNSSSPWAEVALASAGIVGVLATPVGAVLGYNLAAPYNNVGGRLELPAFALTSAERPDHSVGYGVKVQVAGIRF
jgi:hypothetical protein